MDAITQWFGWTGGPVVPPHHHHPSPLWLRRSSRCWNVSEKLNWAASCEGGLWCPPRLSVYAELSPGTHFNPKQLESLKKKEEVWWKDPKPTHTHTPETRHTNLRTTKEGRCSLELQQLRHQFVEKAALPASLFKDRPSEQISSICFSGFQKREGGKKNKKEGREVTEEVCFLIHRSEGSWKLVPQGFWTFEPHTFSLIPLFL